MWSYLRDSNYFLFEFIFFLRFATVLSSTIAQNYLLQDKLCLLTYNQTATFCQNIEEQQSLEGLEEIKNQILAKSALYGNYIYIFQCIPMFIWSLFVGSFLDKYKPGTMLLLMNCFLGDMVFVGIYLVNIYFYSLAPEYLFLTATTYIWTGGLTSFLTAMYQYAIRHSTEQTRSLKFTFMEVSMVLGVSFGTYISGRLLVLNEPKKGLPQLRTYYWNFLVNLIFDCILLSCLFTVYQLDKAKKIRAKKLRNEINASFVDDDLGNNTLDSIETIPDPESSPESQPKTPKILSALFNFENIKLTFSSLFKSRPGNTRFHLYTLLLIMFFQVFVIFGMDNVLLPFAEKVYFWKPVEYSTYSSLAKIASTVLMAVGTTVLVKKFKVSDGPLTILSHVSSFFSYLATGTFLNPWSYFIAIPIGLLNNFAIISLRSIISKIVAPDEVGKIFSIISTLESAIPIFASSAYANLFAATIGTLPGMIYQFSAGVMLVSICVAIFQDLYFCKNV